VIFSLHDDKGAAGEAAREFPFLGFVKERFVAETKTRPWLAPKSRDNGRA
jgi:hypothetical protein